MLKLQYQAKYLKIIRVRNKDMHKSLQEFDFWHIQTADIVELIGPEKTMALLLENYSKYFNDFTWWLSGERSLPFGLLVLNLAASVMARKWRQLNVDIILNIGDVTLTLHVSPAMLVMVNVLNICTINS